MVLVKAVEHEGFGNLQEGWEKDNLRTKALENGSSGEKSDMEFLKFEKHTLRWVQPQAPGMQESVLKR